MDAKHTPGPWAGDCEEGIVCLFAPGSTLGFDSIPIAEVGLWADVDEPDDDYKKAQSEAIANARLIAAAPDLLAALLLLKSWVDNWSPDFTNDPEWPGDAEKIRAAIAKAEGGQQ